MNKIPDTPLAAARQALREATEREEGAAVDYLLQNVPVDTASRDRVVNTASAIVTASRVMSEERGTLDAFMQEFGLSNQEGVALMCLAEALLRIPDGETQDLLIAEKMRSGDWASHRGQSESSFVNASVWALMLTGNVVRIDPEIKDNPKGFAAALVSKLGEPVIRQAVMQAMRIMGRQFVFGRTIKEALARQNKQPEGKQLYSFDMLGEGARTQAAADRYQQLYQDAIRAVGEDGGKRGGDLNDISSISIKLSALHPRFEDAKKARVLAELTPRLKTLCQLAADYNMGLTIDAEEAGRLDLSLDLLAALARDRDLKAWQGLGLAVQAYQKRAIYVIDWLIELSRETGRRFPARLVKGAYWDSEIKHAQEMGLKDYPVFTRKASTDLSYLVAASKMLKARQAFYCQFATHNAHTIAAISDMAGDAEMEFQRLHGMGELLYKAAEQTLGKSLKVRGYAPVGEHEDLLPYLVRRLLENGANSSFVNRFMDADVPVEEVARDPVVLVESFANKRHAGIPVPRDLYGAARKNSRGVNLTDPLEAEALLSAVRSHSGTQYDFASIVGGEACGGSAEPVLSPVDRSRQVGTIRTARPEDIEKALSASRGAQGAWDRKGGVARAEILRKLADLIEDNRALLIDLMNREAGKCVADGISEVREAADFCRYYAHQADLHFAGPERLAGPTGERDQLSLHGRGTFLCISPWNFPLAIFTGQVAAALAAGNAVIAKPADQTPLIAACAVRLAHQAGVPKGVLHLLTGTGADVGAPLVADERIDGVAFTGSTATAKAINRSLAKREGAIVPLIAETGGQNAMIVDSSALTEQVTDDVMASAFQSAGQRCSALRVLFLQESIADRTISMIKGALSEQSLGDPAKLATDIGPIIDEQARDNLEKHIRWLEKEAVLIAKGGVPRGMENGTYLAPHIFEIPSLALLKGEVFGPILHIVRFRMKDIDQVLEDIQKTGFGLTFGIHSRIEGRWRQLFRDTAAGNAYINRNMIGAVVGVQPFGGTGLSGTGPKAGGPRYLFRFATERTLSINTAAIGGNTDLFQMQEGPEI